MVSSGLPALRPDFHWDWDSSQLPEHDAEGNEFPLSDLPRRPPAIDMDIQEAIRRAGYGKSQDKVTRGSLGTDSASTTQKWHQQLTVGTEDQLLRTRMGDLEAVERRANKLAAENAIAAKRLERREVEISAVEERARQTMAELAKQKMRANSKDAELQHREDLTLAREEEVRAKATRALESHAAVAKKEERFEKQAERTREAIRQEEREFLERKQEAQDELSQMREEARQELVKKREDADQILMEKIRKLEEQRTANRQELATCLGKPGAYLERTRAELADREAELAVEIARRDAQLAAREQEFVEWEDQLYVREQQQLAEHWEVLRIREDMQKRIALLDKQSDMLVRKEDASLLELMFSRWRALSVDGLVQMKLSQLDYPSEDMAFFNPDGQPESAGVAGEHGTAGGRGRGEGRGRGRGSAGERNKHQVRQPVAWFINPMNSAARRDEERDERQDRLDLQAQQAQALIKNSVFFIWRGFVLKLKRALQSRGRAEKVRLAREELPKGIAWEVKGLQMKKWELEQDKETVETRLKERDHHALHTVFFMWKHLHRDPRKTFEHQRNQTAQAPKDQSKSKPAAWSIDTSAWPIATNVESTPAASSSAMLDQRGDTHSADQSASGWMYDFGTPSPRSVGNRGKPFNYVQEAGKPKLKVVRLSQIELPKPMATTSDSTRLGPLGLTGLATTVGLSSEDAGSQGRLSQTDLSNTMLRTSEDDRVSHGGVLTTSFETTMASGNSRDPHGRVNSMDDNTMQESRKSRPSRTPSELSSLSGASEGSVHRPPA